MSERSFEVVDGCLMLGDFCGDTVDEVRSLILSEYEEEPAALDGLRIVVAFGDGHAYEDSHQFVFMNEAGEWLYHEASHCSCYGFEDLWNPGVVEFEYLLGRSWGHWDFEADTYKYDKAVREHLEGMK